MAALFGKSKAAPKPPDPVSVPKEADPAVRDAQNREAKRRSGTGMASNMLYSSSQGPITASTLLG